LLLHIDNAGWRLQDRHPAFPFLTAYFADEISGERVRSPDCIPPFTI